MFLYLFMTILWLVVAVGLFVWNAQNPGRGLFIPRTDISLGWFGLAASAYNLVRWLSRRAEVRASLLSRDALEAEARRRQEIAPTRRYQEPDPNFDFGRMENEENEPRTK
jgi:hypothetical protein